MRRLLVLAFLAALVLAAQIKDSSAGPPMMVIEMKPGDTHLDAAVQSGEGIFGRWLTLDAASISTRYRHIDNLLGVTTASNQQYQVVLKGSVVLDPGERFTIHAGLFTGNSFTGGWNNAGPGTGVGQSNLFVKQLFMAAKPIAGVEIQYGGLEFARGESSEITSYDYDGYLVGSRVLIRRPKQAFFDEIGITYGYVGDLTRPSVLSRFDHLNRSDYHQFQVTKHAGRRLRVSADYTSDSRVETYRQAVTFRAPVVRIADSLHFEQYERAGAQAGYGFSAYGERKLARRLSLGTGYAQLDARGLYSDRFNTGQRLFWNGHIAISREWSVMTLATHALSGSPPTSARTRFDLIVGYNLLRRLQSAGFF
jgi:hypothetical protein